MIQIDSEFQSLIPPLTDDEYQRLERSILSEGVREPIITWNNTIIDGHNRWSICQKHDIECPHVTRDFESRDAAKIWIYGNQLGRRNLEPGQKAALVIERNEAKVREAARLRQASKLKQNQEQSDISDRWGQRSPTETIVTQQDPEPEKGRTAEILAKQAGVGEATIKRVLKVKRENPELYDKVRSGEVSTHTAYKQVAEKKKPSKTTDDGRRICSYCGKPINDGEAYACHPNMHKRCRCEQLNNTRYKNPDISLIENVAVYNIESLLDELTASANSLHESWMQSIEINEEMGAKLSVIDKKRLENAANNLIEIIEAIRKETA